MSELYKNLEIVDHIFQMASNEISNGFFADRTYNGDYKAYDLKYFYVDEEEEEVKLSEINEIVGQTTLLHDIDIVNKKLEAINEKYNADKIESFGKATAKINGDQIEVEIKTNDNEETIKIGKNDGMDELLEYLQGQVAQEAKNLCTKRNKN